MVTLVLLPPVGSVSRRPPARPRQRGTPYRKPKTAGAPARPGSTAFLGHGRRPPIALRIREVRREGADVISQVEVFGEAVDQAVGFREGRSALEDQVLPKGHGTRRRKTRRPRHPSPADEQTVPSPWRRLGAPRAGRRHQGRERHQPCAAKKAGLKRGAPVSGGLRTGENERPCSHASTASDHCCAM